MACINDALDGDNSNCHFRCMECAAKENLSNSIAVWNVNSDVPDAYSVKCSFISSSNDTRGDGLVILEPMAKRGYVS